MRPRSLFFALALSFATFSAHADDASRAAKIQELFQAAHIDELTTQVMNQTFDQLSSGMMQQMLGVKLTADQQQKVDEFSGKIRKVMLDGLSWKSLEPEYAKLYAATYTEDEVDGILAFYKSPSGQAMVKKSPMLIRETSAVAQERMKSMMPQIQQLMKDFVAQAKSSDETPKN